MDTKEASKYLFGISDSTLFKKAQAGLIPPTPHKKFRRVDLDAYIAGGTNRGQRNEVSQMMCQVCAKSLAKLSQNLLKSANESFLLYVDIFNFTQIGLL